MTTVVSLRKFSRSAPELAEAVLITFNDGVATRIIGEFIPAPQGAQETSRPPAAAPARPGAPEKRETPR